MTYHMGQDDAPNAIHVYPNPTMIYMCNAVLVVGSHGNAIFTFTTKPELPNPFAVTNSK